MIGVKTKLKADTRWLESQTKKATFKSLGNAAAAIRLAAIASIQRGEEGPAGEPVHTSTGRAWSSLIFNVDRQKQDAVIGFSGSRMGTVMEAHEKGGKRYATTLPARPTMLPALQKNLERFHREWKASI